jgi:predicted DNA-binding protein
MWYYITTMKTTHPPCDEQIVLRLPAELRDKIEHVAASEGRSLANMTRRLLQKAVQSDDEYSLKGKAA